MELGRPASQVARELALRPEQIRDWEKKLVARGEVQLPVRVETAEAEVRRLRRELAVLRREHASPVVADARLPDARAGGLH